jgi:hypothetical protein
MSTEARRCTQNGRAYLSGIITGLAVATLIAACSTGPSGATASPRSSTTPPTPSTAATQGSSPSPISTRTATPTLTATPVPSPSFGAHQIEHPTGVTDVVLRMEVGGGFVPIGFLLTEAPTFTLYGDGTVIFQQVDNRLNGFDLARLPWLVGHLDEEAVQALLNFSLTTGRLANAREQYDQGMVADAPTTVFNLNAGGVTKTVNVPALMELTEPGPDAVDRQGFLQLSRVLTNFADQEELGDVVPYDADMYRVVLNEGFGDPAAEPKDWPWSDVTPNDFVVGDEPGAIANLDGEHAAKLLDVPNGGHPGVWVLDPDEKVVQLGVRPLLPDEIAAIEEAAD